VAVDVPGAGFGVVGQSTHPRAAAAIGVGACDQLGFDGRR
jgi:hypothetical protein